MTHTSPSPAAVWMERFLEAYARWHPVNATFLGLRGHNSRLPDVSPDAVSDATKERRWLLAEAAEIESSVTGLEAMDLQVAQGFLRTQLWEGESGWLLGNPSAHVGEAAFGLMSLLLPGSAPSEGGADALRARLADVPAYLETAKGHLTDAPSPWTARAVRECRGALSLLDDLARGSAAAALKGVDRAAAAFHDFRTFLETDLSQRPRERVGCGEDAFQLLMKEGHFLTQSADEIVEYARAEIERTRRWLLDALHDFDEDRVEDVLTGLAAKHPPWDGYVEAYEETWQAMREVAEERELLTWPEFPIRYVERPEWSRRAAPDLYFLFYRSPSAFDRPPIHDYLVAPRPPRADADERTAFLSAQNDSVIKLNHVVHHGGIGHHVQNWHAFRSPLLTGRIGAVDCASRIAMFTAGTMAEGWACYATDLMAEAGGLTPREIFAEHHGRIRMCARAIVDVELHHERISLDQAREFYVTTAGMSEAAAESEAVKNSMFPGAALMYLVGTDLIHELRADLIGIQGEEFSLRAFHDDFLSYGSIPVRLVADEMRNRAKLGLPLGAHGRSE